MTVDGRTTGTGRAAGRESSAVARAGTTRRMGMAAVAAMLAMSLSGCALIRAGVASESQIIKASEELKLDVSLERAEFRPGEAVVATVRMTNASEEPIEVRDLSAESAPPVNVSGPVEFFFGPTDRQRRVQRFPVVSPKEEMQRGPRSTKTVSLAPGESKTRQFVLTSLTEHTGEFIVQVHLDPYMDLQARRTGKIYSEPVYYQVKGQPVFSRDSKGLILMEDAQELAADQAPGQVRTTDALLVRDDVGFYKWWVNVDYASVEGATQRRAYLVDPYIGRIWSEAKPFTEEERPGDRVVLNYLKQLREQTEAEKQQAEVIQRGRSERVQE